MKITYAIGVCTEHKELDDLLHFLVRVKTADDDINVLVDSENVTNLVRTVLEIYKKDITVCERKFDGNFSAHRNYHITQCKGDYILMLDADEIPQHDLLMSLRGFNGDILYVPRINICPGYTAEWLLAHKFQTNECGWINWPDYQGRFFKNDKKILWQGGVHEKLTGGEAAALKADPRLALWHIKSIRKQDKQNAYYDTLAL